MPYNFTATKQNPTDVLTYSIIPSAYSNYFTLQPTPAAHLLTNIVFDYDTMIPSTHTVVVCKALAICLFICFSFSVTGLA